jgi:dGTPase
MDAYGPGPLSRYRADLVLPEPVRAEVAVLKAMALRYVLSDPSRLRMQERQRALLTELVRMVSDGAPESLDPVCRQAWNAADSDPQRQRILLDQVASLTEAQAVRWYRHYGGTVSVSL